MRPVTGVVRPREGLERPNGSCPSDVGEREAVPNEEGPKPRPSGKARPGDTGTARPDTAGAPGFFLAVYRSTLGASRIYRVYPDGGGLSFVGLGPPHPWIDLESARKLDTTHWAVRTSQVVRKGVALAIAGGSAAAGVLAFALLRAALKDTSKVLDLVVFLLTAVGIFVPLGLVLLTGSIRLFTGRVARVDALTDKQIRTEAEGGEWFSFRVAARDIGDVCIGPVETKGVPGQAAALLSFTHKPKTKWKLELVAAKDTKAAVRAFRQLLGADSVEVNVCLKTE